MHTRVGIFQFSYITNNNQLVLVNIVAVLVIRIIIYYHPFFLNQGFIICPTIQGRGLYFRKIKIKCGGGQMSEYMRLHTPVHFMFTIRHEGTCSRPNRVFSIRYDTRDTHVIFNTGVREPTAWRDDRLSISEFVRG